MPDQNPTSQQQVELEKKLHKRERRLQERLQEARQAHAKALERLKRAESRVQKRQLRIQRVEGRLAHLHQQLQELTSPLTQGGSRQTEEPSAEEQAVETNTTPLPSAVEPSATEAVPAEEASTETANTQQSEQPSQDLQTTATQAAVQSAQALASAQATKGTQTSPSFTEVTIVGLAKIARAVAQTTERAARIAMGRAVEVASRLEQLSAANQEGSRTRPQQSQTSVQEVAQITHEHEAVPTRETEPLADDNLQGKTQAESLVAEPVGEQQTAADAQPSAPEAFPLSQENEQEAPMVATQADEVLSTDQSALLQEDESEASAIATQVGEVPPADQPLAQVGGNERSDELSSTEQSLSQAVAEEQVVPVPMQAGENVDAGPSSMTSRSDIEEIEDEEEVVSAVAAMMIADVAAAAAAEAEALAEASSVRTREARLQTLQADQVLEEVRTAIASGVLSGEDAETSLHTAELEATHAHALLADAEAAEEQARNAAMNAEAEAEVAEGMAFAADEHISLIEQEVAMPVMGEANGHIQSHHEADLTDELDITMERPVIRPQELE